MPSAATSWACLLSPRQTIRPLCASAPNADDTHGHPNQSDRLAAGRAAARKPRAASHRQTARSGRFSAGRGFRSRDSPRPTFSRPHGPDRGSPPVHCQTSTHTALDPRARSARTRITGLLHACARLPPSPASPICAAACLASHLPAQSIQRAIVSITGTYGESMYCSSCGTCAIHTVARSAEPPAVSGIRDSSTASLDSLTE